MTARADAARRFRELHAVGRLLVLPNGWDAASARLIEACGAEAVATTSSGVAWACGHPEGDAIPPRILADAVARIARVVSAAIGSRACPTRTTSPRSSRAPIYH